MPRKAIDSDAVEKPQSVEDKLDLIILHLQRLDNRDRTRMIGSYIKSAFTFASILIFLGSTVWFAVYGPQLIKDISGQMIQQSMGFGGTPAQSASSSTGGYMQMLQDYMNAKKK